MKQLRGAVCVKGSASPTTKPSDVYCPEAEYEKSPHKPGFNVVSNQREVKILFQVILFAQRTGFFYHQLQPITE